MDQQQQISPGVAAILSLFVPGLGQACQGRLGAAVFVFGMVSLMYLIAVLTFGLGLLLAFPCHIIGVIEAAANG
jgi:TM2 domain-containing membrane protein YozV